MRKILTIAVREFKAIVGTKAFLLSIAMMPILMFGSFVAMEVLQKSGKVEDKRVAIIDPDGNVFESLKTSAGLRNAALDAKLAAENATPQTPKKMTTMVPACRFRRDHVSWWSVLSRN